MSDELDFARLIVATAPHRPDHACRQCVPFGEIVQEGFVCTFHRAKHIVDTYERGPLPLSKWLFDMFEHERPDVMVYPAGVGCVLVRFEGKEPVIKPLGKLDVPAASGRPDAPVIPSKMGPLTMAPPVSMTTPIVLNPPPRKSMYLRAEEWICRDTEDEISEILSLEAAMAAAEKAAFTVAAETVRMLPNLSAFSPSDVADALLALADSK